MNCLDNGIPRHLHYDRFPRVDAKVVAVKLALGKQQFYSTLTVAAVNDFH